MPRNIEIKARIESAEAFVFKAAKISNEGPIEIFQDDTFFNCATGRLKLRAFSRTEGELIFYRRADEAGPKESFYQRSPTADPDAMRELLTLAYGQSGRVRKHRTLYLAGRTRIHLDRVAGLGEFLELEVVLKDDESAQTGVNEAYAIMTRLGIDPAQLVQGAYVDMPAPSADPAEGAAV